MKNILYWTLLLLCSNQLAAKEYHVSPSGSDVNEGSVQHPLRTINAAAQRALSGDTVTVHNGTYREWVNPLNGGDSDKKRIIYRVAEGERAELKGSELISNWEKEKKGKGVWKVTLPNSFFGAYNPYADKIYGDWFENYGREHHTGDVYLNDVSLYETSSLEKVLKPDTIRSVRDPEGTTKVWFGVVDSNFTTIYANFGESNPNKEIVEISVRPTCFYPTREGLDYITIRGFEISQAATQWAPPTAEQVGMIATHWCKGWIIEDNKIKNSRCNGITLGKERRSGHNVASIDSRLDGTLHYIEVVFNTLRQGWNRANIGSHIIRNNVISDCEQTAICGSMGGAFSEIYGNHIFNIWSKRQFNGCEQAGIKLHGAIDTHIHHNRIHKCGHGMWLDWMPQGARISSNLCYDNTEYDLFTEVSHGPFVVDNNFFLSKQSLWDIADGGAYLNNLFAGNIDRKDEPYRYTPYHLNHSTEIKGFQTIINGDHRFYNNIFIGGDKKDVLYGLCVYDTVKWTVFTAGNFFCKGAKPMKENSREIISDTDADLKLEEEEDGVYLSLIIDKATLAAVKNEPIDLVTLGSTRLSGLPYEYSNGTPFSLNKDYFDSKRSEVSPMVGPVESLDMVNKRLKIW